MKPWTSLAGRSVTGLVRLACFLALAGLAIMCFAVLSGRVLPVMLAMSLGHLVGGSSLVCFVLAVIIDTVRRGRPTTRPPPNASIAKTSE